MEDKPKLYVRECPHQITILYPSGVGALRVSSKETFVADVAKVVAALLGEYKSLSFDGPGWVRDELASRGLVWRE